MKTLSASCNAASDWFLGSVMAPLKAFNPPDTILGRIEKNGAEFLLHLIDLVGQVFQLAWNLSSDVAYFVKNVTVDVVSAALNLVGIVTLGYSNKLTDSITSA